MPNEAIRREFEEAFVAGARCLVPEGRFATSRVSLVQFGQLTCLGIEPCNRDVSGAALSDRNATKLLQVRRRREPEIEINEMIQAVHDLPVQRPLSPLSNDEVFDRSAPKETPNVSAHRFPIGATFDAIGNARRAFLTAKDGGSFDTPTTTALLQTARVVTERIQPSPKGSCHDSHVRPPDRIIIVVKRRCSAHLRQPWPITST